MSNIEKSYEHLNRYFNKKAHSFKIPADFENYCNEARKEFVSTFTLEQKYIDMLDRVLDYLRKEDRYGNVQEAYEELIHSIDVYVKPVHTIKVRSKNEEKAINKIPKPRVTMLGEEKNPENHIISVNKEQNEKQTMQEKKVANKQNQPTGLVDEETLNMINNASKERARKIRRERLREKIEPWGNQVESRYYLIKEGLLTDGHTIFLNEEMAVDYVNHLEEEYNINIDLTDEEMKACIEPRYVPVTTWESDEVSFKVADKLINSATLLDVINENYMINKERELTFLRRIIKNFSKKRNNEEQYHKRTSKRRK